MLHSLIFSLESEGFSSNLFWPPQHLFYFKIGDLCSHFIFKFDFHFCIYSFRGVKFKFYHFLGQLVLNAKDDHLGSQKVGCAFEWTF